MGWHYRASQPTWKTWIFNHLSPNSFVRSFTFNYVSTRVKNPRRLPKKAEKGHNSLFSPWPVSPFWPWYTFRSSFKNSKSNYILFAQFAFNGWRNLWRTGFFQNLTLLQSWSKESGLKEMCVESFRMTRTTTTRGCKVQPMLLEDDAKKCSSSESC